MGGVALEIQPTGRATIRRAIEALAAFGRGLRPLMEDFGAHVVSETQQRFAREESPEGEAWKPLSDSTVGRLRKRIRSRKRRESFTPRILKRTLRLLRSIASQAGPFWVRVGSNVVYSRIHQLGGEAGRGGATRIDPRAYLGVTDDDWEALREMAEDRLRRMMPRPLEGGA